VRPPGFGIAARPPAEYGIHSRRLRAVAPRTFSRSIPLKLAIGKTARLTFSGRSQLLRTHRTWWVTFGVLVPWKGKHPPRTWAGPHGSYWLSGKTFST
jgi:hypothetical protein